MTGIGQPALEHDSAPSPLELTSSSSMDGKQLSHLRPAQTDRAILP